VRVSLPDAELQFQCQHTMPPSPYSGLLASHLPRLDGATAIDVGTGCGILAIAARRRGASVVLLSDRNPHAAEEAVANGVRNGVNSGLVPLLASDDPIPLPPAAAFDAVICNPASLPMRRAAGADSPYFAGPDGRQMIDQVIDKAPLHLRPRGRILLVQTSLADHGQSIARLARKGFAVRIRAQSTLPFRSFYDKSWIDELGGERAGLYRTINGTPHETISFLEARYSPRHPRAGRQRASGVALVRPGFIA
jgi:methylase of polypeptide subunit release factors